MTYQFFQIKFYHFFFSKGFLQTFELRTHLYFAKKNVTHSTLQGFTRVLSKEREHEFEQLIHKARDLASLNFLKR